MSKVRIIGGGISGLMTAYYLVKQGAQVIIYEQRENCGGKIRTTQCSYGMMESAANAILADQRVEDVALDLGVELCTTKPEARRRYILKAGSPSRWPMGLFSTLRLMVFIFKFLFLREKLQPQKQEVLSQWSVRLLGEEFTRYMLDPMCQGIFGATSDDLSATLIFRYFFGAKKQKGKLRGSLTPLKGMGHWSQQLRPYLEKKGVQFILNTDGLSGWSPADKTIIATDIHSAHQILAKMDDPRAELLAKVPMVDVVSLNLFFPSKPLKGFGLLFPRSEQYQPLGVLFNSSIFPYRANPEVSSETWIFGKKHPYSDLSEADELLISTVKKTRQELWGLDEIPLESKVNRWVRALPLYGTELETVLEELPIERNNVFLMGNYLGEIGLNRIFARAEKTAHLVLGIK